MKLPKFKTQHLIRIVYKSGYVHDFWCWKFSIEGGAKYRWDAVGTINRPIQLGVDEVAAVYQIDRRVRLTTRDT
jgi:hypothetical protein